MNNQKDILTNFLFRIMSFKNFITFCVCLLFAFFSSPKEVFSKEKTRVIITSDGEIDDECSLVRFLLYTNEWDVEGLITSSSQYHWRGHKWAGDNWAQPYLDAYQQVENNLRLHDPNYPTAAYLKSKTFLGNVDAEGEMTAITPGSTHIVNVLLDESDNRPVWIQAWGGTNTLARALKTIEDEHPEKMAYVAKKMKLFMIWEQDETYQKYIKPHWGKYNIFTIISDQFIAIMYYWKKTLPLSMQSFFESTWMNTNIIQNHGPLCSLYKAHVTGDKGFNAGDFRSEGDSPAYFHLIETGLANQDHPEWGGWGGRYVNIRENTWLDPVKEKGYQYPTGRWYGNSAWGRERLRKDIPNDTVLLDYLKPMWQWADALQNDFAARADWCVKPFAGANHPPKVVLNKGLMVNAKAGEKININANASTDPDNNVLTFKWWQYVDSGSYPKMVKISKNQKPQAAIFIPKEAKKGQTIHIICQVSDNGSPSLTRYKRVVITLI